MKIRHKLLLIFIASALAASVLVGVGSTQVVRSAVRDRFLERIRAEGAALKWWVALAPESRTNQQIAVAAGGRLGYRVTFIAADGVVLGDSAHDLRGLAEMENHAGRPEIACAMREGSGDSRRSSTTTGEEYFYYALRADGARDIAVVRIALPTKEVERVQKEYSGLVALIAFLAMLLLTGVAYVAVRRMSKPIEAMTAAAVRTAGGDLRSAVPVGGEDEIGRLADSVNRMKSALVRKIEDLDDERRLFSSVVAGIKEGLLLLDGERRVSMANDAFRSIFGVDVDPTGRLLAEVVRHPSVIEHLEDVLVRGEEKRDLVVSVPETGRTFELHAAPIVGEDEPQSRGVLALFFDITRLESLEKVRREFVADVSHELRTPLTSIRAFVETLIDGGLEDGDNCERFLTIIQRHAGFMGDLIDDLTDLSRIETGAIELDPETVDLGDLVQDVVSRVGERHPSSDVEITTAIPDTMTVRADRRRLSQILVNLVDNAVKFNRPGGDVKVTARTEGERAVIEVADSGIGIPSENLEKVFNRFHRVDQARSREIPGTGLGLAIVKHLMRLHGGSVTLVSELWAGSTFTLTFPG
jgi:two-component system phosphate regulon sensor histidine kinase PhoR